MQRDQTHYNTVDGEELLLYRGKSLDDTLTIAQDLPLREEDPSQDDHITDKVLLEATVSLDSFENTYSTESTTDRMGTNLLQDISIDTQVSPTGVIEFCTTDNITEMLSDRREGNKLTHAT